MHKIMENADDVSKLSHFAGYAIISLVTTISLTLSTMDDKLRS